MGIKQMKSNRDELRKRGMAEESDVLELKEKSRDELYNILICGTPVQRTAAVRIAGKDNYHDEMTICRLLKLLTSEDKLYTKLEICLVLEKGSQRTAEFMMPYLGEN